MKTTKPDPKHQLWLDLGFPEEEAIILQASADCLLRRLKLRRAYHKFKFRKIKKAFDKVTEELKPLEEKKNELCAKWKTV